MTVNTNEGTRETSATREPSGTLPDTMRTLIETSGRWFGEWAAANNEMIAAIGRQMGQNAAPSLALPGASLLHDALTQQIELGQAAVRQYLDTTQRLLSLGTETMVQGCAAMCQAAEAVQRIGTLPIDPRTVAQPRDRVNAPPRAEAA